MHEWSIRVSLYEHQDDTTAQAVLVSGPAEQTDASGSAHRSARDPASPRIGDEIAVARALRHLSDKLFERARQDVENATGEHDVDIRAS
nr:dsRBD fold-containing protein [Georgenia soli]